MLTLQQIRDDHQKTFKEVMAPALWRSRRQLRISRPELAKKLGINRSTLLLWESGRSCPPRDVLVRWQELMTALINQEFAG